MTAPFLNSAILMYEPDRVFTARTDEEKALQWAHRALRDRLLGRFGTGRSPTRSCAVSATRSWRCG